MRRGSTTNVLIGTQCDEQCSLVSSCCCYCGLIRVRNVHLPVQSLVPHCLLFGSDSLVYPNKWGLPHKKLFHREDSEPMEKKVMMLFRKGLTIQDGEGRRTFGSQVSTNSIQLPDFLSTLWRHDLANLGKTRSAM